MIKIYHRAIKDPELRDITEIRAGSWVYVENPTGDELDALARDFSLERGLLQDALDPYEAPRTEAEGGAIYVFTRIPHRNAEDWLPTVPILIVLGKDFFITLSARPLPFLDKFFAGKIDFYTTQKTKLFLQVFAEINQIFSRSLADINKQVRGLSVNLEDIGNKDILQLVAFERVLNDFIDSLVPTNNMLKSILSGKILALYAEDEDLMEDLLLSNTQIVENCNTNIKTIGNIRESYSSIMTNNINRVMKLLTALTIILAVPNVIAGFFGMNVAFPFVDHPMTFLVILASMVVILTVLVLVFIKNRWL